MTVPFASKARWIDTAQFGHVVIVMDSMNDEAHVLRGDTAKAWASRTGAPSASDHQYGYEPSWGTQETPARLALPGVCRWRMLAAAVVACLLTLLIRALGPRRRAFFRLRVMVQTLSSASRVATHDEATAAVIAVRSVAQYIPARFACLEESVSAIIVLALARRRATWCHGVALGPLRFHAWVSVGGEPAAEPPSTDRFTLLVQEPDGRREHD